jgi:glycosyltransferase involved in cell wall biosynthesis
LIENFRVKARASKNELIPSINEENFVIVSTGRFDVSKDQNTLLRAVSMIKNVSVVLIGDGPTRLELEGFSEKLNISNRVHFLGRREDVPEILAIGDIYVQSSNWEGFGIAAVEAMASGLPIIASNVPGLCDVVGTAGLLFDAGNAEMLAQLIKQLIDDEDLRKKYAQESYMRSEAFSLNVTASKYIDLYKQLV